MSVCLSYVHPNFSFWIISKYQWSFTILGLCIDIVEIRFGTDNEQMSSIVPATRPYFLFRAMTSKYEWIFTRLGICIDIVEIRFGIASGQISPSLPELSARHMSVVSLADDNLSKYKWTFTKTWYLH